MTFLQGVIIKALRDPYCIQLVAFEATQTNPDGTPVDALSFAAIKAYLDSLGEVAWYHLGG